ncbi:MAG: 4Fe-4S binding protein [Clostridiales bacterium]|nr:4Fe-4S binding protein [Clostridiales bacterium]
MIIQDGIPTKEDLAAVMPSAERLAKGPVAITECFQNIACNPCTKACVKHAISMEPDMNATPKVDTDVCNGCGACIARCPGLAIFVVDMTYSEKTALVKIPFEFIPVPEEGKLVCGLNRAGEEQGWFRVVKVVSGGKKNMTYVISLEVPKELAMEVRNIRVGGYRNG